MQCIIDGPHCTVCTKKLGHAKILKLWMDIIGLDIMLRNLTFHKVFDYFLEKQNYKCDFMNKFALIVKLMRVAAGQTTKTKQH